MTKRWAIKWNNAFQWDGASPCPRPYLFYTKREAVACIREKWGYIATRGDLRKPPFNWRMPKAAKVEVLLKETT